MQWRRQRRWSGLARAFLVLVFALAYAVVPVLGDAPGGGHAHHGGDAVALHSPHSPAGPEAPAPHHAVVSCHHVHACQSLAVLPSDPVAGCRGSSVVVADVEDDAAGLTGGPGTPPPRV